LRSRTPRTLAAASLVLAALVGLGACSTSNKQAGGRHKLNLKIGALVPLSGTEQPFGATGQKAVNLALGEIRKAIDTADASHTVTITHENYRSDPKLAQDFAGRLQRTGTSCLVGPWSNVAVIPVATTISVPKKIVTITPAAGSDALEKLEIGGYLNRTVAPDRLQGQALATTIADALGGAKGKKVSVAALRAIYGIDLVQSFSGAWQKLGGKVAARVIYESNLPDYKKQAAELVAPKPDAFVFFDFQETYLKLATELIKTHKWKPSRSFAADSLAVGSLGQSGGATVEGLRGVAPSWPRFGASAKAFARLWQTGPPPAYRQPYDPQAFDATVLCYLSAVAAGSTNGSRMRTQVRAVSSPPGTKYTWRQLGEAIRALEAGKEIDYDGASGPLDIEPLDTDKPGDPTAGFYDTYRFVAARLSLYGSVSVPPSKAGVEHFPVKFVTPRVPGATPVVPKGASGASGASGAKGKTGKGTKKKQAKKKGK
jgi:ABC-type branched-subunit amino acid transport system substrate-binding protein